MEKIAKHPNTICIKCNERWLQGDHPYITISMCRDCVSSYKTGYRKTDANIADDMVYERINSQRKFERYKPLSDYLRKKPDGSNSKNTQD